MTHNYVNITYINDNYEYIRRLERFLQTIEKLELIMNKIKISRPKYRIPLKDILDLFRKELNAEILNKSPSEINKIIEKNKKYFNHIGVG